MGEYETIWNVQSGRTSITKHLIQVTKGQKILCNVPCTRNAIKHEHLTNQKLAKWWIECVVEPSELRWTAQISFAPERWIPTFGVTDLKLNAATKRDYQPIRRMVECTDLSRGESIFSTTDANHACRQAEIKDAGRCLTASISHPGLSQILHMPLGLCNASGVFQSTMDVIHLSVKWQFALVSLHNNVIFSRTERAYRGTRPVLLLRHWPAVTVKWKEL